MAGCGRRFGGDLADADAASPCDALLRQCRTGKG